MEAIKYFSETRLSDVHLAGAENDSLSRMTELCFMRLIIIGNDEKHL